MWYNYLDNLELLTDFYDKIPNLNSVTLGKCEFNSENCCIIDFEFNQLIDKLPQMWPNKNHNSIVFQMLFSEISNIKIHKKEINNADNVANIIINQDEDKMLCVSIISSTNISFKSRNIIIDTIFGFETI